MFELMTTPIQPGQASPKDHFPPHIREHVTQVITRQVPILHPQLLVQFDNGYATSTAKGAFTYGTEMAVMTAPTDNPDDWSLTYETPVTDDVIGHIESDEEWFELLEQVMALPQLRSLLNSQEEVPNV